MKQLPFHSKHVSDIVGGQKTATVRKGWGKNIETGEEVVAVSDGGQEFARLSINGKLECRAFDAFAYIDINESINYGADSLEEFMDNLEKYYDGIGPRTKVTVYIFERA